MLPGTLQHHSAHDDQANPGDGPRDQERDGQVMGPEQRVAATMAGPWSEDPEDESGKEGYQTKQDRVAKLEAVQADWQNEHAQDDPVNADQEPRHLGPCSG